MEGDKETATRRIRRLRRIGRFLPCIEAAGAALLFLSYYSFHTPATPKDPGEFLRRAAAVLVRPGFVFLLGNAIILLVFAKSGQISPPAESISNESKSFEVPDPPPPHLEPAEEVVVVCEDGKVSSEARALTRSRSEKLERAGEEPKLRRSETLVPAGRRREVSGQDWGNSDGEDDAEQFRRTIEEFIAKQQRFQREELLAVVPFPAE